MASIAVLRTPTPGSKGTKIGYTSPPARASSELTPPPSTQIPKYAPTLPHLDTEQESLRSLASPSPSSRMTPFSQREPWNGRFPTLAETKAIPESDLRDLVDELLPTLGETRMALAHSNLQLNLLSIEAHEAVQRAEVEHDMTRREVEVLQAGSPVLRNRAPLLLDPMSPLAQVQRQLEISIERIRELEADKYQLQRRLKQAKRVIKHVDGRNLRLSEDNKLLRERIRQNRDHANAMRLSSLQQVGHTPRPFAQTPPQREKVQLPRSTPASRQDPLDALLMADQILNSDPASVPATPTPSRALKLHSGHTRGTQSLSSLPSTPTRIRPSTADELLRTPLNQVISSTYLSYSAPASRNARSRIERAHEDRDSTISASEDEAITDEDLPASQASQAASGMLLKFPGFQPGRQQADAGKQEPARQTRLLGKVTKHKSIPSKVQNKREAESDGEDGSTMRKRARLGQGTVERVGLGIGI